jgi:hypothetical protein
VAGGQSNVADRRHASHIAIVWPQSEASLASEPRRRAFAFCSAVTKAPTCSGPGGTSTSGCRNVA